MEVLVLDGKKYIKAARAARDLGYTADYVGQLCRSGQVNAHIIGRSWYVDMEALRLHRFEKKRMSRIKAREQAKQTIAEHRAKRATGRGDEANTTISYEDDESELIPKTRRVEVESWGSNRERASKEEVVSKKQSKQEEETATREGSAAVDQEADSTTASTTVFKPEIVEKTAQETGNEESHPKKQPSQRVTPAEQAQWDTAEDRADPVHKPEPRGIGTQILLVVVLLALVAATWPLSTVLIYNASSVDPVTAMFSYRIGETVNLLKNLPNIVNPI